MAVTAADAITSAAAAVLAVRSGSVIEQRLDDDGHAMAVVGASYPDMHGAPASSQFVTRRHENCPIGCPSERWLGRWCRLTVATMGVQVVANAQMMCSFGTTPSALTAIPMGMPVQAGGQMAATIQDFKPMANIKPFGMCTSMANPQVSAATTAAQGVLTPQPCIPVTVAPWKPGSPTVMINNQPALTNSCTAQCNWAGVITISSPGQMNVMSA